MESTKENCYMMSESELFDHVCRVISKVCEVTTDGILNKREMPYPVCRGICWVAMRSIMDITFARIAKLISTKGRKYTTASVNTATTKALNLISTSYHWRHQWEEIKKELGIKPQKFSDDIMRIQVVLPKEARNKIKIMVIEK